MGLLITGKQPSGNMLQCLGTLSRTGQKIPVLNRTKLILLTDILAKCWRIYVRNWWDILPRRGFASIWFSPDTHFNLFVLVSEITEQNLPLPSVSYLSERNCSRNALRWWKQIARTYNTSSMWNILSLEIHKPLNFMGNQTCIPQKRKNNRRLRIEEKGKEMSRGKVKLISE